jgi:hypothetical protein
MFPQKYKDEKENFEQFQNRAKAEMKIKTDIPESLHDDIIFAVWNEKTQLLNAIEKKLTEKTVLK